DRRQILLAGHTVGHRSAIKRCGQVISPKLLACVHVERAQPLVISTADKNQTAVSGDGPAHIRPTGIGISQSSRDTESHLPGDLAGVDVNRPQIAPWRLLAWHAGDFVAEPLIAVPHVIASVRLADHDFGRAQVRSIDYIKARLGVEGCMTPVDAAPTAGEARHSAIDALRLKV